MAIKLNTMVIFRLHGLIRLHKSSPSEWIKWEQNVQINKRKLGRFNTTDTAVSGSDKYLFDLENWKGEHENRYG